MTRHISRNLRGLNAEGNIIFHFLSLIIQKLLTSFLLIFIKSCQFSFGIMVGSCQMLVSLFYLRVLLHLRIGCTFFISNIKNMEKDRNTSSCVLVYTHLFSSHPISMKIVSVQLSKTNPNAFDLDSNSFTFSKFLLLQLYLPLILNHYIIPLHSHYHTNMLWGLL